ncbi:FeoB small GTPase domain-containing protein [Bacillus massiliigorillae]|uniref:FeoB small GTPase domain-containing protein n=1 Tax=Bacillus massiliigorillae TaxID=1243664 RepID=UPI0003A7E986|nr:FeoB small GTPase domain-containing protein [Bacillus massiliigorillae]
MSNNKYRIALAGNPNTGKSTLFNALTGMNQHTGNWPGKTVEQAIGLFTYESDTYEIIDLPGTYSLYSNSTDEEVARDFIIFEKPDVTLVVVDATSLERNLNLALQVLEMTSSVILCVNLIDEATKKGITVNAKILSTQLGIPVVTMSARNKIGIDSLLSTIQQMVLGKISVRPLVVPYSEEVETKIKELEPSIKDLFGDQYPTRWIALRLLDGDTKLLQSLTDKLVEKENNHLHVKERVIL